MSRGGHASAAAGEMVLEGAAQGSMSVSVTGARSSVLVGGRLVAAVFAVLTVVYAVVLTGTPKVVMSVAAGLTAITAAWILRTAATATGRQLRRHLLVLCVLALVNSEAYVALTGEVEHTTTVVLVVLCVGAVLVDHRDVVGLLVLAWSGWLAVVLVEGLGPLHDVAHLGVQLALGTVLAVSVFRIRHRVLRQLQLAHDRLRDQRDDVGLLRARTANDLARLRSLVDASPVGLAVFDEQCRITEVNPAICTLVGREERDLLGQGDALFTHPDDVPLIASSGELITSSPTGVARLERRLVRPDSSAVWVGLTLTHVAGPVGETHTLVHAEDITDRKTAEERLRRSHEMIEAAGLVAQAAARAQDPRGVLLAQTRRIAEASSTHFVERGDADHLTVVRSEGLQDFTGNKIDLREASVTRHVWETGETIFVDQAHGHPRVDKGLLEISGAQSLMWSPVSIDDEVVAIISIVWTSRREVVTEMQRAAVRALAAESSLALLSERVRTSLEEWSTTDPLTGLLNRRGWDLQVKSLDERRVRESWTTTIAILDLDHFKAYNDTHGHNAGDTALSNFGKSLSAARREDDLVARWGGEEFVVAMPHCDGSAAMDALERLRSCVPSGLTCSAGYAVVGPDEAVASAIRRADVALYTAKNNGRDQIRSARQHVGSRSVRSW